MHPLLTANFCLEEESLDQFRSRYTGFGSGVFDLLRDGFPEQYGSMKFYKATNFQMEDAFAVYASEPSSPFS